MLSNAYFLAKFRFDTAENEPSKVCRIPSIQVRAARGAAARGRDARLGERARSCGMDADIGATCSPVPANFTGLVLGCIEAKFCKKICV